MFYRPLISALLLLLVPASTYAVVTYKGDNDTNASDPGTGLPFDSVGMLSGGTAVYLGDGYMLTANHVSIGNSVIFADGSTYAIDSSFTPVRPVAGVDLKVFKLEEEPGIIPVSIYTGNTNTVLSSTSYVVGSGLGRNPSVSKTSSSVKWGNASTRDIRWGLASSTARATSAGKIYFKSSSSSPTSLTTYDSGSPLFTYINGEWYITAIAVSIDGATAASTTSKFSSYVYSTNELISLADYFDTPDAIFPE